MGDNFLSGQLQKVLLVLCFCFPNIVCKCYWKSCFRVFVSREYCKSTRLTPGNLPDFTWV